MCILRLEQFDQLQRDASTARARRIGVVSDSSLNSDAKRRIRRSRVSGVSSVASVMSVPHRVHILRLRCVLEFAARDQGSAPEHRRVGCHDVRFGCVLGGGGPRRGGGMVNGGACDGLSVVASAVADEASRSPVRSNTRCCHRSPRNSTTGLSRTCSPTPVACSRHPDSRISSGGFDGPRRR